MKTYTIVKSHRDRKTEFTGTLEELTQMFSYTLEKGYAWQNQRGCKKVNKQPKTIKALLTALANAVYNTQGSCYEQDYYELKEV